ncbi:UDP-N-acetylmuramoyl-tripeptide--D-alanyl-D-alanine ligase [Burkholderiales bacterium]|nr:UDP-N-acetylmuramoyl-tripeptide--D-alanyl-D-alanine ligase [Burkholderiales bacterium]
MKYRLSDLPALLATPAGWLQVLEGVNFRLWPLSSRIARLHRRTLASGARVVAVVGSSGKSTTMRAVSAALGAPPFAVMTHNAWSYVARAVLRIRRGQRHAVIEVGIAGRNQMRDYASVVRPDVTVVTSIGSEHHRSLVSLDVTRDEKAWMVRALPAHGVAVLNGDDPNVMWMASETAARVVTFGFGDACDVRASDACIDWPDGTRFRVGAFGDERDARVRLVGRHMVYAALAAIAVARVEGVALDDAIARVAALAPTPGRMQPVALAGGATILRDEYKGSIETIDAALEALSEIDARRRIVVLGDISEPPGQQHRAYRRIGERVAGVATHFLVVGSMHEPYFAGARHGGMPTANAVRAGRTPREAARALSALIEPGDVVLVKGRDTQRLERITLILQGRTVGCDIRTCEMRIVNCEGCPMLERGWGDRRVAM